MRYNTAKLRRLEQLAAEARGAYLDARERRDHAREVAQHAEARLAYLSQPRSTPPLDTELRRAEERATAAREAAERIEGRMEELGAQQQQARGLVEQLHAYLREHGEHVPEVFAS